MGRREFKERRRERREKRRISRIRFEEDCLICLFFTFLFPLCLTVVVRSVKKERAMKNHFTFAWELSITYDIAADQFPQSDIHLSVFEITFAEVSCV